MTSGAGNGMPAEFAGLAMEVLERIEDGFIAVAEDGRIVYANPRAQALAGTVGEVILGRPLWEVLPELAEGGAAPMLRRAIAAGKADEFELPAPVAGRWLELRIVPLRAGVAGIFWRDIGERKRRRARQRIGEERLRLAQEGAGIGVWDWNLATGELYWSPQMFRLHGIDPEEADLYAAWLRVMHPDDRERAHANAQRRRRDPGLLEYEFRVFAPDGSVRWILAKGLSVARDESGRPARVLGINLDVTERKQLEAELRASEARYRLFADATLDGVVVHDFATILDVSPRFAEMFGYAPEELIGRPVAMLTTLVAPEDLSGAAARADSPDRGTTEVGGVRKDGSRFPVEYSMREMSAGERRIRIGVVRDITERKAAARAIAEREERLRLAIEAGRMIAWERLPGEDVVRLYSGAGSLGRPERPLSELRSQLHPDDAARVRALFEAALAGTGQYQAEYRARDNEGRWRWMADRGTVHRDPAGTPVRVIGVAQDITERRHIESELRELTERLEARVAERTRELAEANEELRRERLISELIVDNIAEGIIVLDPEMRHLVWNPAMERINGTLRSEVLWRRFPEVFPRHAEHRIGECWREALAGRKAEMREHRFFSRVRGAEIVYDADFSPLYDRDRAIIGAIAVLRETTERHRVEEMLRQSQKLEAVAQLTGGVAHDFNNLLTAVIGYLEMIALEHGTDRVAQLAQAALRSAGRGAQLTQQLLAFARRQSLRPVVADLGALLAEFELLLRRAVGETIEIVIDTSPDLARCVVDPAQFEAAVMNLVMNARDAMPHGGRITLITGNFEVGEPASPGVELRPGKYVAFTITDTGIGMASEVVARAVEPFYTTKEPGKGSGLGLSMVHGFAVQSGGGLRLHSTPGVGTRITLYLPATALPAEPAPRARPPEQPRRGSAAILVVEDDDAVREASVTMLGALGYRVTVARDGPEALRLLRRRGHIDLLFTDIVMPGGLSGLQLARQAQAIRPGLKVLLTTGYARVDEPGVEAFSLITKPFRPAQLSRTLADLLGGDTPGAAPDPA